MSRAPLTPPECDLQDFAFMPLHVSRLRDSDLANEEHPEACWYAVLLWSASWHQIPAASLPDNETVLAKLCGLGRDVRTFRKHRAGALRGFVLCDDGRLYHPMVAEQAIDSWRRKIEQRWRSECARVKKANQRNGTNLPAPTLAFVVSQMSPSMFNFCPGLVPGDTEESPPGQEVQETETETETGTSIIESEAKASADLFSLDDPNAAAWALATKLLIERGRMKESAARALFGRLLRDNGIEGRDLLASVSGAIAAGTTDPQGYLTKAAQGVAARKAQASAPAKRVGFV